MNYLRSIVIIFGISIGLVSCVEPGSDLKKLNNLKPRKSKSETSVKEKGSEDGLQSEISANSRISRLPKTQEAMSLPNSLREISGLSFDASANGLIAHDDELAILYRINFEEREIVSEERIGSIGDFEGVEMVDDMVYLITSAGEIIAHNTKNKSNENFSTGLNAINNVEGLAYYNGQLLIACKGKPEKETGQSFADCRSIYSFSLQTKTTSKVPYMLLRKDMLSGFLGDLSSSEKARVAKFAPSGIAVHPSSKLLYILSHKGKMLVVTNAQAEIQKIYFLDNTIHRQPEGICFDDQERMYIANESNEGAPVIYRYSNY